MVLQKMVFHAKVMRNSRVMQETKTNLRRVFERMLIVNQEIITREMNEVTSLSEKGLLSVTWNFT